MTLIAQISDLHLRDDGQYPAHDPADALIAAFATISELDQKPSAIILTGDIIDRNSTGYDRAVDLLRNTPVPLLPMPGNHDRAAEFRATFADWAGFAAGSLDFIHDLPGLRLIALDTTLPDGSAGLRPEQLDWLHLQLSTLKNPGLLALHHPPFATGLPHLDRMGFAGATDLADLLRGSAISRIIAGHSHRAIDSSFAGIASSTAPALGHGLSLSFTGAPHRPIAAPPVAVLHHLQPRGWISHQIPLGL